MLVPMLCDNFKAVLELTQPDEPLDLSRSNLGSMCSGWALSFLFLRYIYFKKIIGLLSCGVVYNFYILQSFRKNTLDSHNHIE